MDWNLFFLVIDPIYIAAGWDLGQKNNFDATVIVAGCVWWRGSHIPFIWAFLLGC